MSQGAQGRGRPAVWASAGERQRQYRSRRAAKLALVDGLLHAVRTARLDDTALHQLVREGDDATVLRALTACYEARHFMKR